MTLGRGTVVLERITLPQSERRQPGARREPGWDRQPRCVLPASLLTFRESQTLSARCYSNGHCPKGKCTSRYPAARFRRHFGHGCCEGSLIRKNNISPRRRGEEFLPLMSTDNTDQAKQHLTAETRRRGESKNVLELMQEGILSKGAEIFSAPFQRCCF